MSKESMVLLCGIHSLLFALFHLAFWKLFHWKKAVEKMSVANRAILQILNLRLIYVFLLVAFLCFFFPADLAHTRLGHALLIGMSLFWLGRTVEQLVFLRINDRLVHMLTLLFVVGSVLFLLPVVS